MLSVYTTCSHILLGIALVLTRASGQGTAPHEINCDNQADGLREIGCWGYANCVNGKPDVHRCSVGNVLDRSTMTCVKPGQGKTDCHLPVDCTGKPDASYADYGDNCISYYRCINQINLGRFYCPQDTAFNENLQLCDYPRNLPAPCGTNGNTKAPATTTTHGRTTTLAPTTTTTDRTTTPPATTTTTTMNPTTPMMSSTTSKPAAVKTTSQMVLPIVG